MKTHLQMSALKMRIMCDPRVPATSLGYVEDLKDDTLPEIIADRLLILARYIPELIEQYKKEISNDYTA